eukprot:5977871-Alexandrium_andersonii.AAC.1
MAPWDASRASCAAWSQRATGRAPFWTGASLSCPTARRDTAMSPRTTTAPSLRAPPLGFRLWGRLRVTELAPYVAKLLEPEEGGGPGVLDAEALLLELALAEEG